MSGLAGRTAAQGPREGWLRNFLIAAVLATCPLVLSGCKGMGDGKAGCVDSCTEALQTCQEGCSIDPACTRQCVEANKQCMAMCDGEAPAAESNSARQVAPVPRAETPGGAPVMPTQRRDAPVRQAPPPDPGCESHFGCGSLEICIRGRCESALNRVYRLVVSDLKVHERRQVGRKKGRHFDGDGGLPDPMISVRFPTPDKEVGVFPAVGNTTTPQWNYYLPFTLTAGGQSMYICFYDGDGSSDPPDRMNLRTDKNCTVVNDVVEFIKNTKLELSDDGDIERFVLLVYPNL